MIKYIFFIFLIGFSSNLFAAHVVGGEMIYEYLGPGAATNTKKYRITLKLFKDNTAGAALPASVIIGIFENGTQFGAYNTANISNGGSGANLTVNPFPPCINNPPMLNYSVGIYPFVIDLPNNSTGYDVSYQTCCRTNGIENVFSPGGTGGTGSTYWCKIPGSNTLAANLNNSSPQFRTNVSVVCFSTNFSIDFGAFDPDGDSLAYSFCPAFNGGGAMASVYNTPASPPFGSVPYQNGYVASSPMGPTVNVNSQNGLISGVAPALSGGTNQYVVCVCVREYRNGVLIGTHQKDFQIKVNNCSLPDADLGLDNVTCDGFNQTFINFGQDPGGLINSYFWDFGVAGVTNDTSILQSPSFIFPDTGVYTIKLIVNKGQQCQDSATRKIGIYPGFFPNFNSVGVCFNSPIQFNDAFTTNYGFVDSWSWDFGNAAVLDDTSRNQNPSYQYPSSGPKLVQLIATNSKGCIDTITKTINLIDRPILDLPFKDTLICSIDTLQLVSIPSSGNVTWTPNYRIINPTSTTPSVYPLVTTTYTVTANDQGCIASDTIRVNVKDFVTVDIMPDTAICLTDGVRLVTTSDALSYIWTPAATLDNPLSKSPIATPTAAVTKYKVSANIGKCQSADSVTIVASPYPQVQAFGDTTICFGSTAFLSGVATGTNFYWDPPNGLINGSTLTPIAKPVRTTQYILTTQGAVGCPKPAFDTVTVTVIPPIIANAGRDTTIVKGQQLQLFATGSSFYQWYPSTYLSNDTINNPIATPPITIQYAVKAYDAFGCYDYDSLKITVFQTGPEIFVPTAFSPNNDGTNDLLTPVAVGLLSFDFFEVYNRYGQLVYRTTQIKQGWDGKFRNLDQAVDTYVWQVRGTDYTGKRIFKKGTTVLIR